ncbi:hypothetical protein E2C01_004179 [Portunus trituberculatus]|uniref:Uncharacterized protein n=1 Tax=Portunus trituberculatus TaxID=210409 RepID=A0A5B7CP83_PORTR|nr:hypothetical protein [Portunus trituberculatus]
MNRDGKMLLRIFWTKKRHRQPIYSCSSDTRAGLQPWPSRADSNDPQPSQRRNFGEWRVSRVKFMVAFRGCEMGDATC